MIKTPKSILWFFWFETFVFKLLHLKLNSIKVTIHYNCFILFFWNSLSVFQEVIFFRDFFKHSTKISKSSFWENIVSFDGITGIKNSDAIGKIHWINSSSKILPNLWISIIKSFLKADKFFFLISNSFICYFIHFILIDRL